MKKAITNYKNFLSSPLNSWRKCLNFNNWLEQWLDWENFQDEVTKEDEKTALKRKWGLLT